MCTIIQNTNKQTQARPGLRPALKTNFERHASVTPHGRVLGGRAACDACQFCGLLELLSCRSRKTVAFLLGSYRKYWKAVGGDSTGLWG